MAKIGFFVLPNTGGMNASLRLAEVLRERGHDITYLGLKDSENYIRNNGFQFISVFETYFPTGFFSDDLSQKGLIGFLHDFKSTRTHFGNFFKFILSGGDHEFIDLLRSWKPDLMVFASGDMPIEWPALMAYSLDIKCVYFHSCLWPCEKSRIPSIESDLIPTPTLISTVKSFIDWKRYRLTILPKWLLGHVAFTKRLSTRYKYFASFHQDGYERSHYFRLPELESFPLFLDFPGAEEIPGRHYIEASISVNRKQADFPWEKLDKDSPLVLCAFGTYLWFDQGWYRRFFRTILDVARSKPEWQWVLATGRLVDSEELGELPANVIVVENVPQLALLQRAHMMVTHGGTNTIKECVYFGVPMVIFPFGADHPGNTARVVYHGLGVKGDLRRFSAPYLKERVEAVDRSFYIRSQMQLAQERLRKLEEDKPGLRLIEGWLEGGTNLK